jgi:hypothetical protein
MKKLNADLGGELLMREGLKREARTREKAKRDYDGHYGQVVDILGGSLVFDTE